MHQHAGPVLPSVGSGARRRLGRMREFVLYTAARFGIFGVTYAVVLLMVWLVDRNGPLPVLWPLILAAVLSTFAVGVPPAQPARALRPARDRAGGPHVDALRGDARPRGHRLTRPAHVVRRPRAAVTGLEHLQPVAERVGGVEAAHAREVVVPPDLDPARLEPRREGVDALTRIPGCALRAGWKSSSTPRWTSTPPPRNQQPPRAASTGGFSSSSKPRVSRQKSRQVSSEPTGMASCTWWRPWKP